MSTTPKLLYRTPRVLTILFLCFLFLFSFDVIEPGRTIGQIALGMLIHNIPVLILLAVLIISWKYEIVGGIVFGLATMLYVGLVSRSADVDRLTTLARSMIIAGPALLISILFLIGRQKKQSTQ